MRIVDIDLDARQFFALPKPGLWNLNRRGEVHARNVPGIERGGVGVAVEAERAGALERLIAADAIVDSRFVDEAGR